MRRLWDWQWWGKMSEEERLRPDWRRAVRLTVGLMVPLGLAAAGWMPLETTFVVIAANGMSLVDVRGAYRVRFGFLLVMVVVLSGTTGLGMLMREHVWMAVLGAGVVAVNGGVWRQLTPEYGPSLATPAALLYFIAVMSVSGRNHLAGVVAGGVWGLLVQVGMWPVRKEHPLRRVVSESWVAAGELFGVMGLGAEEEAEKIAGKESELRGVLDRGYKMLEGAQGSRAGAMVGKLEKLHMLAARLVTDVGALNTAIGSMGEQGEKLQAAWDAAARSLGNAARSLALAVVSRQPAHVAMCEVGLRRVMSLLEPVRADAKEESFVEAIVGQVEKRLKEVGAALRDAVDGVGERGIFSLELLEVNTWTLKPLGAVLNLSGRPDPAIVRYTLRLTAVTMIAMWAGMWAARVWGVPHGYWLPFTVVVVLQADYGATRVRAVQRLLGTLVGGLLGSGVMLLKLPREVVLPAVGVMGLLYSFFLRRNYAVAVVFVTLFVVLLTEVSRPVTLALTMERLGMTAAGGVLAMAAAVLFWPMWERERFPKLLVAAMRRNREYLGVIAEGLENGSQDREDRVAAKRLAERANREMFGSLERWFADPTGRREGADLMAVAANGNQRLTRELNLISVQMGVGAGMGKEVAGKARGLMAEIEGVAEEVGGTIEERKKGDSGEVKGLSRAAAEVAAMREAVLRWRRV